MINATSSAEMSYVGVCQRVEAISSSVEPDATASHNVNCATETLTVPMAVTNSTAVRYIHYTASSIFITIFVTLCHFVSLMSCLNSGNVSRPKVNKCYEQFIHLLFQQSHFMSCGVLSAVNKPVSLCYVCSMHVKLLPLIVITCLMNTLSEIT